LVGLPNAGKSTIFNALTLAGAKVEPYPFCTIEPHHGVAAVPDGRLDRLHALFPGKRKVPTTIEVVDIAGLVERASQGEGLGNQFLAEIRGVEAILHVVRCFQDPDIAHPMGELDVRRDIGVVDGDRVRVSRDGNEVERAIHRISWSREDARKAGYEHFMLKEIHEQSRVIRDTIGSYTGADESLMRLLMERSELDDLLILACGTSYHAGMVGKYIIEEITHKPVRVELASEFSYNGHACSGNHALVLTQSGETADVLKTMKKLKSGGCPVTVITNVVGSTASRIADHVIYTHAGPEISVAATKTFIAQLMALYWLALPHAQADTHRKNTLSMELRQLPGKVEQVLDDEEAVAACARQLTRYQHVFFIGRGINYPIALEGALKLKEISYLHAEGYAAGELKHGPFALLGEDTPVVAIVARDTTYDAMLTGIKEVKARRSPVLALVEEGDEEVRELADTVLEMPKVDPLLTPVVHAAALQLLAYYTAKELGRPIDYPRNLAKSVTVE